MTFRVGLEFKLTGGGRGGCEIGVCRMGKETEEVVSKLKDMLAQKNMELIESLFDDEGFRYEN